MKNIFSRSIYLIAIIFLLTSCSNKKQNKKDVKVVERPQGRWTVDRINKWYHDHEWIVGCNYVPANAINQLEMWQADTFSPELIDKELGWAENLGFNTLRVFLHYLPWKEDKEGFYDRVDQFLSICDKHSIKVMLILFDDVWHPIPKLGTQPEPTKGVHNSGWVQCPGKEILGDVAAHEQLKPYVQETVERYGEDNRVLIWDLYNEPANPNSGSYGSIELKDKEKFSLMLLKKAFEWAREINPSQPICSDVWRAAGHADLTKLDAVDKFCYEESDLINFHVYAGLETTKRLVESLKVSKRPLVCTEYMARTAGSTFESILPHLKLQNVAAYNWGFVNGKSNTIYPWASWQKPFEEEPKVWFHDIFRQDGTPFSREEIYLIKSLTK